MLLWVVVALLFAPPLFAQSDPDDIYWDGSFGSLSIDGPVFASESSGDLVFLGGRFTSAAKLEVNNIIVWNKKLFQWDSLGAGLDGEVRAMLVIGNDLYVGGSFHHAGGVEAHCVARWDIAGRQWHAVGSGTDTTVWTFTQHNGEIYMGGSFQVAGGVKTSNLVAYNPSTGAWRKMLDSLRAPNYSYEPTIIHAIAFDGDDMYIGGLFEFIDTTAGKPTIPAGCIALRRNGVWRNLIRNNWPAPPVHYGASGPVWKIVPYGQKILIGGEFAVVDQDGSSPCNIEQGTRAMNQHGFTAWDKQGEFFHYLPGGGIPGVGCGSSLLRMPCFVYDIIVYQNRVFLTGNISQAGTIPNTSGIVEWVEGSIYFKAVEPGPLGGRGIGHTLHIVDDELLIAGEFDRAGQVYSTNAALWNGFSYRSLSGVPDNGAAGPVFASLVSNGNLYIGGSFTSAGGKKSRGVARWDGSAWNALDTGVSGSVYALASRGNDIYVGGAFSLPGSPTPVNVARWDGTRWYPLGSGLNDTVRALTFLGTDLVAGGQFTRSGASTVNHIGRWNGSAWSEMGSGGADNTVFALSTSGSTLHAGGSFGRIGGVTAGRVAEWNGSAWSSMGGGVSAGTVYALAENTSSLYVGGDFQSAGSVSSPFIVAWNKGAATWLTFGTDARKGLCNAVYALALKGNDLYVGGAFPTIGDAPFSYVARWDGLRWNPLGPSNGNGTNDTVRTLVAADSGVYAGGWFSSTASGFANHVAEWNTGVKQWSALGEVESSGLNGPVSALALSPEFVYAGGTFLQAGPTFTRNIARYSRINGSWFALTTGVNGPINALLFHQGKLYVGGQFSEVGGITINNLAVWDPATETWSPVGSGGGNGTNGPVHALFAIDNKLYVGGRFSQGPAGYAAHNVFAWDIATNTPSSIGGADSTVTGFAYVPDFQHLFVAGAFQNVNSDVSPMRANYVARYRVLDGVWERLGAGLSDPVYSIHALQQNVYLAGPFLVAGTIQPQRVARWDNRVEFWDYLGSGIPGTVITSTNAIHARGREVFVGGNFQRAGAVPAPLIARWDTLERQWKTLGSGLEIEGGSGGFVSAIVSDAQDLWVGGNFTSAGQKGSLFIARWTKPSPTRAQSTEIEGAVAGLAAPLSMGRPWPNPFGDRITMPLQLGESQSVEVAVLDRTGAVVTWIIDGERLAAGTYDVHWTPPSEAASGVYFLRVRVGADTRSFPITLVR